MQRYYDEGQYSPNTGAKLVVDRDQLGNARDILDVPTAARVASYDYTPYGEVAAVSGTTTAGFAYAGLLRDNVAGLYYSQTRPYDAVTGRWLGRDPIAEAGGINLYQYTGGDPVNRKDLSGLYCHDRWCDHLRGPGPERRSI